MDKSIFGGASHSPVYSLCNQPAFGKNLPAGIVDVMEMGFVIV
jgi:hypothetical protein